MDEVYISDYRFFEMVHGRATDVTPAEFRAAIKLAFHKGPSRFRQALYINYPHIYKQTRDYGELRHCCRAAGLNPDEHELKFKMYNNKRILLVDGYWVMAYKMLFTLAPVEVKPKSNFYANFEQVRTYLIERDDFESLALLNVKYDAVIKQREEYLRNLHGLSDSTEFETIDLYNINGMSYRVWRVLYDDKHIPTSSSLTYWLRFFEEKGELEKVAILREKYKDMLEKPDPIPSMEHPAALSFRDYILSPEFRQQLIERNRERSMNDAADN